MKLSFSLFSTYRLLLQSILILFSIDATAQDLFLQWAKILGGKGYIQSGALEVDANGFVYTTGSFLRDSTDFDPGPGVYHMISSDTLYGDIFVSRLDNNGNFSYAYSMGSAYGKQDKGTALISDATDNIYVAGYFFDTTDFNPAPGATFNMISAGQSDCFISKLNSNNELQWAKRTGGGGRDTYNAIDMDTDGNIYTTGIYVNDFIVYKINPQGDTIWSRRYAPTNQVALGNDIAVDNDGNVYVTGYSWGMGILPTNGNEDAFVIKFNSDGDLIWVKGIGGTTLDFGNGLVLDGSGNIYVTGLFSGVVDFNPSTASADTFYLSTTGGSDRDVYILKLTTDGDFVWAVKAGGSSTDAGGNIVMDSEGSIYVTGSFSSTAMFGGLSLISNGGTDAFLTKLNSAGSFLWAKQIGGSGNVDAIRDIKIDATDNIFLTGTFNDTVDLDIDNGEFIAISQKTSSFILKFSSDPITGIEKNNYEHSRVHVYPNPVKDFIIIDNLGSRTRYILMNTLGQTVMTGETDKLICANGLSSGFYFLRLENDKHNETVKIVKE